MKEIKYTAAFDYALPPALIAQHPLPQRSGSRLLYLNASHPHRAAVEHLYFRDLPKLLRPNDLLVFNNTRVIKARLFGRKLSAKDPVAVAALANSSCGGSEFHELRLPAQASVQAQEREQEWQTRGGGKVEILIERLNFHSAAPLAPLAPSATLAPLASSSAASSASSSPSAASAAAPSTSSWSLNTGATGVVLAQLKANRKVKVGTEIILLPAAQDIPTAVAPTANSSPSSAIIVKVIGRHENFFVLQFPTPPTAPPLTEILEQYGHVPLPPYIERADAATDTTRYQSIFAAHDGAVAAPTASLHFDDELMQQIKAQHPSIQTAFVTLHVGAGTFQPVRVNDITQHQMHAEYIEVSQETCDQIIATKQRGGRVIAVGTTCVRCLESACLRAERIKEGIIEGVQEGIKEGIKGSGSDLRIQPFFGDTDIFIYPGYRFRCVDALITNFHLPKSTLLMLVCAFAGYDNVMCAYAEAVRCQYRFFSYGDAMFVTRAGA
jgi:S-adenosylmethionine:tRNA ribosyltransferase-isomerase